MLARTTGDYQVAAVPRMSKKIAVWPSVIISYSIQATRGGILVCNQAKSDGTRVVYYNH
jgi:hypothetical protein